MQRFMDVVAGLSTGALVALTVLAVVQVMLQAWALVDLARRGRVPVSKGFWVAVIVLLNLVGPLIYFAAGRGSPAPGGGAEAKAEPGGGERTRRAVDALYGGEEGG